MSRRASLVVLLLGAGLAMFAVRGAVVYDFDRYVVLSGFEASRWTWLLVVLAGAIALFGLFLRKNILPATAIASGFSVACVAVAIVLTVSTTPHRAEAARNVVDCRNQNIGVGCGAHQVLDVLAPAPPDAAPSRLLLVAALGFQALICAVVLRAWLRRTDSNRRHGG